MYTVPIDDATLTESRELGTPNTAIVEAVITEADTVEDGALGVMR